MRSHKRGSKFQSMSWQALACLLAFYGSGIAADHQLEPTMEQPNDAEIATSNTEQPADDEKTILFPPGSGARLNDDGSILVVYPVQMVDLMGEGYTLYAPDHPDYSKVRRELGDLSIGEFVNVPEHLINVPQN
jgi:hypothetical protein